MKFEFHLTIKPTDIIHVNRRFGKHSYFSNIDKNGNSTAEEYLVSWEEDYSSANAALISLPYTMESFCIGYTFVSRIKIEQKPMVSTGLNFLYHEAHLKLKGKIFPSNLPPYCHRSINIMSGSHWITLRKNDRDILVERYQKLCNIIEVDEREIESIIVDTNRDKDNVWIYGNGEEGSST